MANNHLFNAAIMIVVTVGAMDVQRLVPGPPRQRLCVGPCTAVHIAMASHRWDVDLPANNWTVGIHGDAMVSLKSTYHWVDYWLLTIGSP